MTLKTHWVGHMAEQPANQSNIAQHSSSRCPMTFISALPQSKNTTHLSKYSSRRKRKRMRTELAHTMQADTSASQEPPNPIFNQPSCPLSRTLHRKQCFRRQLDAKAILQTQLLLPEEPMMGEMIRRNSRKKRSYYPDRFKTLHNFSWRFMVFEMLHHKHNHVVVV